MKTYLIQTKFNTYKYQRRVPVLLLDYVKKNTFRVSLGDDNTKAVIKAMEYNKSINEALQLINLGVSDASIVSTLQELIPTVSNQIKMDEGLFMDIATELIKSKVGIIADDEIRAMKYFYLNMAPSLFKNVVGKSNPHMNDITYNHLLDIKSICSSMPKRNIQKYRLMSVTDIINKKFMASIPAKDKVASNNVNKWIKFLKAIFKYAYTFNYIQKNYAQNLTILKVINPKHQRFPLTDYEYKQLLDVLPIDRSYLFKVLRFTGMRLSELYKCKLEIIDDVLCFSLLDESIQLKTRSSYRMIPVHSKLIYGIGKFEKYRSNIEPRNISRYTNRKIKELNLQNSSKKSLYSLRHSFATELIEKGVEHSIVSQLLGHSNHSMTLSRYSSGYSVHQLKEAVEILL
mgnify:CR=1 FL=1|jgi:site-specific recombinase XerD